MEKNKMRFKNWFENIKSPAFQSLVKLRPQMAIAAQNVYDNWVQDEDDEYNGGGICQDIAEAISNVVNNNYSGNFDVGTVSAQCGEQHVWVVMTVDDEAFEIDVPYSMYERGGGYNWQKIQGVKFSPNDIIISPMDHGDAKQALEYY